MTAKLISTSQSAATGAHSTATITTTGDEVTIGFWWKVNTSNALNTVWAGDAGQFQVFTGSGGSSRVMNFRANGSNAVSVDAGAAQVGNWCWFVFRAGINHLGNDDVSGEVWDDSGTQLDTDSRTSSLSTELSSGGTHWLLGDDNSGGTNTDDGFEGEIYDFGLYEGIISNADMPYDTTTGEAQPTLSSAANSAVVYRLRGENSSDRLEDNSGSGNDFTNEGGVTFSETDLPPIASGGDTEVSASTEALTLTEYAASLTFDVDVSANVEALTVAAQQASVSLGVNIEGAAEALSLTTYPASTAYDVSIAGALEELSIAAQQADISFDVGVSANLEGLTLTTYAADVALGSGILANVEELSLSTSQATVTYDVEILASTEALTVTGLQSVVSYDLNVSASAETLSLSTNAASVEFVSGVDVDSNVVQLTLTTNAAEIEGTRVRRIGGDDAFFSTSGRSKEYFYKKQLEDLQEVEAKVKKLKKLPPKRRKAKAKQVFEPFLSEAPKPLVQEFERFEQDETNYAQFRDAVTRYVAEQEKRERRRRQNNDAALALLFAA